MKKSTNLLLALALGSALLTAPAFAQDNPGTGGWTLREAIEYAQRNNLQVKQSGVNRDLNKIDLNQSRMDRLPDLNGNGGYSFNTGSYQNPVDFSLSTENSQTANFQANTSLPLFMGFQQNNLIKQNVLDLQASEQDILALQNDITLQVITSYLNVLFSEELIKTAELQRNTTQQQLSRTRLLFKAGSVAELAVLDLESQLSTDELDIINAQNQRDIARLSLIQLLNLENEQAKNFNIIIPEVPEPDTKPVLTEPTTVYDVALQTQPGVKAADLRVLSADKGLAIARGAYYPRVSLAAGLSTRYIKGGQRIIGTETISGRQEQIFYLDRTGNDKQTFYMPFTFEQPISENSNIINQFQDNINKFVGVNVSIPVFNGFLARNNVQRAKLGQVNAKINADIERNQLRQTIEQAYVDALAAQRKYTAAKQQVTALEKNYKNAELRLNSGVINTVDFLVITSNYRRAQSNLIQAKYEYTFKLKVLDFYQGKEISL
ncbi:TolC family protein [Pontibacter fetidus]|uniref:TolC family protein n=1 Tax=Pontibacter fetidus TaxID=2700082 RepID=A0A6B2H3U5_9BACT|nr:TolC family protein [Pontibacter fetidus]NDK54430.1 TolC family protein [Pontibacter fetidus]